MNAVAKMENPNEFTVNVDEFIEFMRYKQGRSVLGYEIRAVKSGLQPPNCPRCVMSLAGTKIDFMVDTGSQANIIDEATYNRLQIKPELYRCETPFYAFRSHNPLPMLGEFYYTIMHKGLITYTKFYVVEGQADCLLSFKTSTYLEIIRVVNHVPKKETLGLKVKFPDLFSVKMGKVSGVEIKLEVDPSIKPVKQKLRPIAFHLRDAVEAELKQQVEEGILERLDENSGPTEWVSNLVIVPKSTSPELKIRITSDSRAVNKAIKRTRFPCKTIDDIVYLVNGSKVFSKLDIMKAFHQLELAKESRNLTTVTTHIGLYRYKRLHMGVSSASEIFSEVIREILIDCLGSLNMHDDILVYGENEDKHMKNLMKVLAKLQDRGVTLNILKCEFCKAEVVFFGLRISKDGVSPTEDRCEALKNAKAPSNAKELHSFLGLAQYSSRFIPDFATIAAPLWALTKKNILWSWSDTEDLAFNKLKMAISTKALNYFDADLETVLIVDASSVGLGAVLTQICKRSIEKRLVACASRLLSDIESRYSQCEKEALAAVWGCEKFWFYIFGHRFKLVTDNRAVQLIFNNPNSNHQPESKGGHYV